MKTIKVDRENLQDSDLVTIVGSLKKGEIVIYPTDTIYGIGCISTNEKTVIDIFKIKNRPMENPMLVLVDCIEMARNYAKISDKQEEYLKTVWPGPVTVILEDNEKLPGVLSFNKKTVAMRLPDNDFLVRIIGALDVPLVSTSVNKTGEKHLTDINNLSYYFNERQPDLVIDAGHLDGKPSKVVDIRDINNILEIRK